MTNKYAVALANKQIADLSSTLKNVTMPDAWNCVLKDTILRLAILRDKLNEIEKHG